MAVVQENRFRVGLSAEAYREKILRREGLIVCLLNKPGPPSTQSQG